MPKFLILASLVVMFLITSMVFNRNSSQLQKTLPQVAEIATPPPEIIPLTIKNLRSRSYPESDFKIITTLPQGSNYNRYIASYLSDGLTIYGLLTVPNGQKPEAGWPAVVIVHGHLDPEIYETTARYVAYQDRIARAGFVTFKPDLRGHGKSQGQPVVSNFSPEYVYDVLNVVSAFKHYQEVDKNRIGMWGHSMGGGITLKSMVVSSDIKAGVIWAGVVGDYEDLLERYRRRISWLNTQASGDTRISLAQFTQKYGNPSANLKFWNQIDPYAYLSDISGPVQLHHGTADDSVPIEFSIHLKTALEKIGKPVEFYEYQGADHNISGAAFTQAMDRTIKFFTNNL